MKPELINNILGKVKSYFLLPETATDSEVDQKLVEAIETNKPEMVTAFASQITELVQAEATKLNEVYAAQLKTETDLIIGELRTQVADLEKQVSEFKAVDFDAKVADIKKDFGAQLLEFTSKEKGTPLGDGKTIEVHNPNPEKATAPVKIFGAK